MLALLDRATRYGRLEILKVQTRFNLFALRDELRSKLIKGEIPNNNWFEYMDTTLTKSIDRLNSFTVWQAAVLAVHNEKDASVRKARQNLEEALEKPENKEIAGIYNKYILCLAVFLYHRHSTFRFLMSPKKMAGEQKKSEDQSVNHRGHLPLNDSAGIAKNKNTKRNTGKTTPRKTINLRDRTISGVIRPKEAVSIFSTSPETSTLMKYAIQG
jgi:hypothetical protein